MACCCIDTFLLFKLLVVHVVNYFMFVVNASGFVRLFCMLSVFCIL